MSKTQTDEEGDKTKPSVRRRSGAGIRLGVAKQIECSLPEDLSIVVTAEAFARLFCYACATEAEVSLLGIVERNGCVFTVREFFLVAQKGSSAHTELDQKAVGELVERLIAEGRSGDARKVRCWAHSHPGMDVFWSKTDDDNCRRMTADWLLSIVVSDGFKIRCRLDVASPIPFTIDNIPVFLESPIDPAVAAECEREVKEKLQPVTLFGGQRTRKTTADRGAHDHQSFEFVDYCDLCGSWHVEGECPMELESSAYEAAHQERISEAQAE